MAGGFHRFEWIGRPVLCLIGLIAGGCQRTDVEQPDNRISPLIDQTATLPEENNHATASEKPEPDASRIAVVEDDSNRWLLVEKIRGEAKGAWATGDFDRGRNKIVIRTHDVAGFAIDTGRIAVNWDKLVVIGIDGSNSELRRRDYSILHFEIGPGGDWVVREP